MRRRRGRVAGALAALLLIGCGRATHSDVESIFAQPLPPPPAARPAGAAGFAGVGQLSPLPDGFDVAWEPILGLDGSASGTIAYRVYVALDGAPFDFSLPLETTAPGASGTTLHGLASGTRVSVVVQAESQVDASDVDRNEIALDGVVATAWYVDADSFVAGDGRSSATPLRTIAAALQAILASAKPGNVLVAGATYVESLVLPGDAHLYGGYDPLFSSRDRALHSTKLRPAAAGGIAVAVANSVAFTFVDGVDVDCDGRLDQAIVVAESDLQWSNGTIHESVREGIRCTSKTRASLFRLRAVVVNACGDEGLFADGSLVAELTSCSFTENDDEGVHFDQLSVQPAGKSELWIRDCIFRHNDNDGLEVEIDELDPAVGGTSIDGVIEVLVERCLATENRRRGFLVDFDFETADRITTSVVLRDTTAARQGEDGIRVDADSIGLFVLDGNRTSANRECGVEIAGASTRATVVVANHWEIGSTGDGLCVENHVPTILSHVATTGSGGASISGNGSTLLVDGALWLCSAPTAVDATYSFADFPLPGVGNLEGAPGVRVAPVQTFHLLAAGSDRDRFGLPPGVSLAEGAWIEIDDDGVARRVESVQGGGVVYLPPRNAPPSAGSLVARFDGPFVVEDPRLQSASGWQDAGDPLDHDGDGTTSDIGILGGTLETFVPLRSLHRVPFVVAQMTPRPGAVAGPVAEIRARFSRALDPASVDAATFVVLLNGSAATGTWSVVADTIVFVPDAPLAGGTVEVQVHGEIASSTGEHVALPYRYWLQVP